MAKYCKEKYIKYLKTNKWKEIRKIIAQKYNYTCKKCGKRCKDKTNLYGFQVHHKNYKYIFNEEQKLSCLVFLCEDCHKKITEEIKNKKIDKLKNGCFTCKHCGGKTFYIKRHINNIGVYCEKCDKWYKFLNKKEKKVYKVVE